MYYVYLNHCHGLWGTINTCLKTCLSRVNVRQITFLKDYIRPFAHSDQYVTLLKIAGTCQFITPPNVDYTLVFT